MFQLICPGKKCFQNETLSGLTVALALVPEAVAFAFVAGVDPLVGLYGAFIMGLVTALIGGRPGMISGATGAMAVVMVSLVAEHGVAYLFAALVLTGLIQMLFGLMRMGKFIRLVPYPVMLGFVNGLAIVIFLAQLKQFQTPDAAGNLQWLGNDSMMLMLALVALTMAIIHFLPKLTSAVPASLAAIIIVTTLVVVFGLDTRTVQDVLRELSGNANATIAGGLPKFSWPEIPLTMETFFVLLPYSVILAGVGLIESLLTLTLIDEMTETRGKGNQECIGQGVANIANGFFGGMGGCAMIGQSLININSGGRGRMSAFVAAVALLMFILFGSALIELMPVAALVGVMFMVVLGTFEWATFRMMGKVPTVDMMIGVLVAAVTVYSDLAIAVLVGVIVSALVFAWEHAKHITAIESIDENGAKVYVVVGPLFFGSIQHFNDLFSPADDPEEIIVDFSRSRVADHSALEAIDKLAERYQRRGKNLHLIHLNAECKKLLRRADDLVEINVLEDPTYHVADDRLG